MGLFGALFAGVSGVNSQSNKIGAISNNISNVNTVGYKQVQASFNTLVVPSGTTTFSPGGVIGATQNLVTQQGLVQATSSSTDVAITGNGFFVVNSEASGAGTQLLTRAGSFTQDSNGNFVNANGYFLQGIPVTTPPTSINLNNLKTVTVNPNATGAANATTSVTLGANFNAAQSVLLGNGVVATMSTTKGTSSVNGGITGASTIIVGNDVPGTLGSGAASNLQRGASFTITSNGPTLGAGVPKTFTYGGFAIGRNITVTPFGNNTQPGGQPESTVGGGLGDVGNLLDTESVAANEITTNTTAGTQNQITISGLTNGVDYVTGNYANISGVTTAPAGSGLTPAEINGEWKIISSTANSVTLQIGTNATGAVTGGSAFALTNRTFPFTGNVLNATSESADFLTNNGATSVSASSFTQKSLSFTMQVGSNTVDTFTYSASPNPAQGTFNSLDTLAQAISDTTDATARVQGGRLYVSADDPNQRVNFANGDAIGSGGLPGINWLQELDLPASITPTVGTVYFNSLNGLANDINSASTGDPTNLLAVVNNPNASATLSINEANPEQTITFTDDAGTGGKGSVLTELGIANLSAIASGPQAGDQTTGTLPVIYSPSANSTDMSSGKVTPQFSHDVTIFDSQGNAHTIAMNVVKVGVNTWAMELTAVPATDIAAVAGQPTGQIASGTLGFDGNGLLKTVTGSIATTIPINWSNGAAASQISLNLGIQSQSGITQSAAPFGVSTANQNGSPVGQLTGVAISSEGFVTETFSNGQTQEVYQIPLANVNNPDGLQSISGDAFQQTLASGQVNLDAAGTGGTGSITPSALEQSNVDLSTQLTNLIVAQQAYGANAKLLTVADTLLQQLDQIIQ